MIKFKSICYSFAFLPFAKEILALSKENVLNEADTDNRTLYEVSYAYIRKTAEHYPQIENKEGFSKNLAAIWVASCDHDEIFYGQPLFQRAFADDTEQSEKCRPYIKMLHILKKLETEEMYTVSTMINRVAPFNPQDFTRYQVSYNFSLIFAKELQTLFTGDIYEFAYQYCDSNPYDFFEYLHLLGNIFFQAISSGQNMIPPVRFKNFMSDCGELADCLKEFISFFTQSNAPQTKKAVEDTVNKLNKELDNFLSELFGLSNNGNQKAEVKRQTKDESFFNDEPTKLDIMCRMWLDDWNIEKLVKYIGARVIGQEIAVRECAIILYEHVYRIAHRDAGLRKKNYVMFGPTGCGKTELMRVMREISPVPIVIANASGLTAAGYKGTNVQDLMDDLAAADENVRYGIVFLDEFDKLAGHGGDVQAFRQTVQQDILKMLEGEFTFTNGNRLQKGETFTSENITFVCGGAFDGAFKVEKNNRIGIGFNAEAVKVKQSDVFSRLIEYGLIPEIVGRINSIIPLRGLTEDYLYVIMTKSKNSPLKNTKNLFNKVYEKQLVVPDKILHSIAHFAMEQQLGARVLGTLLDMSAHKAFARATTKRITVTEDDLSSAVDEFAVSEAYSRKTN